MIIIDKEICDGYPVIKGTRVTVFVILANLIDGVSHNDISLSYGITENDINDCIEWLECLYQMTNVNK